MVPALVDASAVELGVAVGDGIVGYVGDGVRGVACVNVGDGSGSLWVVASAEASVESSPMERRGLTLRALTVGGCVADEVWDPVGVDAGEYVDRIGDSFSVCEQSCGGRWW